ncbi:MULTISPECIES: hypothetical protein [unclassified Arenibacter]|nr:MULTISPECIES: hypothetical protein [unclassified Arenibacter]
MAKTRLTIDGQESLFFTHFSPFLPAGRQVFFRSDAMQLKKAFNWVKNV